MFNRFNTIHECDEQTERRTPHRGIARAVHSVARRK